MFAKTLRNRKSIQEEPIDAQTVTAVFEMDFQTEIFYSRCQDTGEKANLQKAKMFKESFSKVNQKKHPQILNLNSMRIGVNTIMKLISILEVHPFQELNLADNSISEYGMHAVKNLISSTKIEVLNLSSNMISEIGLSLILEEFMKNTTIRVLDLGIEEGSIRKNSFGIDGARCLAAILLQNKTLQVLKLEDNDIGINGAEIMSIPLKRNKHLKELKISENLIKTQGAEYLLMNATSLHSLDIGKNFIKSSIGPTLKKYLETNTHLRKINLEFNELLPEGAETFFEGVVHSQLEQINIRGNSLGDRGVMLIADILQKEGAILDSLRSLDLSFNDITADAVDSLFIILNSSRLKVLNISKNLFGDEGFTRLLNCIKDSESAKTLEKIEFSACKVSDKGFLSLMESLGCFPELKHLKASDNYISERYEKIFVEILAKNTTVISLTLQGNRLSLSGVKAIKKIVERNLREYQEREPSKMKSQINSLKEKQRKIMEAQESIEKQKKEISALEQSKAKLNDAICQLQREERERRNEADESIRKKTEQIEKLLENSSEKMAALEEIKGEKERSIEALNGQLQVLRGKRQQLEYQLRVTLNEGEAIEREFQKKISKIA